MELLLGIIIGGLAGLIFAAYLTSQAKQYPYEYHVVYSFEGGVGSMYVKRTVKIKDSNDINSVREFIEKENKFAKVVILNWIALNV